MDKGLLEEAAKRAGVGLTAAMLEQTICYVDLLREANRKMNLTSIINDEPVARLHFEDSWRAAAHIPQGVHLIDVGTGAGFPGMALALVRPDLRVTLLDATLKKVKFLQEVAGQLELDRVTAVQGRAEELGRQASNLGRLRQEHYQDASKLTDFAWRRGGKQPACGCSTA